MGGMSFKCPLCEEWKLDRMALWMHLRGKHKEPKGFRLEGVADHTRIVRDARTDTPANSK